MSDGVVARPYASAAFQYALANGQLADWSEALMSLAEAVRSDQLSELLKNPQLDTDQLVSLLAEICKKDDPAMNNFIRLLAENKRLVIVPDIVSHYEILKKQHERLIHVDLISCFAIEEAQQQKLAEALAKKYDRQVELHNHIDSSLIGGAIIKVKEFDYVIDSSISGKINRLRNHLQLKGAV